MVIDGMSRFIVRDGLIAEYRESVNGGVAMAQLGVEPDRMTKSIQALDRMAARSGRKPRLSGAAKRFARQSRSLQHISGNTVVTRPQAQGDRRDLSAHSL